MSAREEMSEELARLVIELLDGRLKPAGATRLRAILREDDAAVRAYVRYIGIHSLLDWRFAQPLIAGDDSGTAGGAAAVATPAGDAGATPPAHAAAAEQDPGETLHAQTSLLGFHYADGEQADEPEPLPSPPVLQPPPMEQRPWWVSAAWISAAAAVVLAVGVAAILMMRGQPRELAKRDPVPQPAPVVAIETDAVGSSSSQPSPVVPVQPSPKAPAPVVVVAPRIVATVTTAIGAYWENLSQPPAVGVPLVEGQGVRLTRGFLQLRFSGGAEVIVEAPSEFTVESATAMSLARGRVTATAAGRARGFVVRTSDADVTDLGTEFGVSSDPKSGTQVHVFQGEVTAGSARRAASTSPSTASATTRPALLKAGDAAALARDAVTVKVMPGRASPQAFVRNVSATARTLDLVDLVSGGDGTTQRRGLAIELKTGRTGKLGPVAHPPVDAEYHRIDGIPVLDGCFLPDSRFGPTPVDSVGNAFQFPEIEGSTFEHIRAGGPITWPVAEEKFTGRLGGVDYGAKGRGMLLMHSNKGLTLDLDAVRRLYPGARLTRFRAVVGNTYDGTNRPRADAFVLGDGKVKFERRGFTSADKPARIDVAVDDAVRFLTLAVTDGGDGGAFDWVIFGDPVLVLEKR